MAEKATIADRVKAAANSPIGKRVMEGARAVTGESAIEDVANRVDQTVRKWKGRKNDKRGNSGSGR